MKPARLAAALLIGFTLRVAAAALTEYHSPFPPHFYNDAQEVHTNATALLANRAGASLRVDVPPGSVLYTKLTEAVYTAISPQPIWPKLLNAAVSTAAAFLWYRVAASVAPGAAASIALWAMLLWPTNIFYGSQPLRDAHIQLLTAAAFLTGFSLRGEQAAGFLKRAAACFAVLFLLGLYRPHSLVFVAVALGAAFLAEIALSRPKKQAWRAAAGLGILAATMASFQLSSSTLLYTIQPRPSDANSDPGDAGLMPGRIEEVETPAPLWTPEGLTQFRAYRHLAANRWAQTKTGRSIGSQIFADARFRTWLDVALFLPKGMFYAMFMPLPGFYPLEGKLGRILASGENLLLLAVFLLAAWSWRRRPDSPAAWPLGLFFAFTAASYGLFEFDLGSATRHRLQYFPALLPFAAASACAWWERRDLGRKKAGS